MIAKFEHINARKKAWTGGLGIEERNKVFNMCQRSNHIQYELVGKQPGVTSHRIKDVKTLQLTCNDSKFEKENLSIDCSLNTSQWLDHKKLITLYHANIKPKIFTDIVMSPNKVIDYQMVPKLNINVEDYNTSKVGCHSRLTQPSLCWCRLQFLTLCLLYSKQRLREQLL